MVLLAVLGILCLVGEAYFAAIAPVLSRFMHGDAVFFFVCMMIYALANKIDRRNR